MPETAGIGRLANAKNQQHYAGPVSGFLSIEFSGQLAVIKTRPGYASGIAWDIDTHSAEEIGNNCRRRYDIVNLTRRNYPAASIGNSKNHNTFYRRRIKEILY